MAWSPISTTIFIGLASAALSAEPPIKLPASYDSRDSLSIGEETSEDARACLAGLAWPPAEFEVRCESPRGRNGDVLVRFPSPISGGDPVNDLVAMEWYVARGEGRRPVAAPAVVVVHESGSAMTFGRLFARGLQLQGLHALLIHLPHYGERRRENDHPADANLVTVIRQAVADVRRARDAVAVLPLVDHRHIAIQGVSLGGFVSATAACLDDGYDSAFLMLAGGDLFDLIQHGEKDTARLRDHLAKAGLTGEKLKDLVYDIEPIRVAHRLNPQRTWLYSGKYDKVVPMKNALALVESAKLNSRHHILLDADHYSGVIYLPFVLDHIRRQIVALHAVDADLPSSRGIEYIDN